MVAFEVSKVRDGVFEISFPNGLEKGEYAFMPIADLSDWSTMMSGMTLSCFGID